MKRKYRLVSYNNNQNIMCPEKVERKYRTNGKETVVGLKEAQRLLVKALEYFDAFCKEHDLNYFVMWGSLLGAVRHKGVIPWDDDVDVAMSREDFEKLRFLESRFETNEYYLLDYAKNTSVECNEIRVACKKMLVPIQGNLHEYVANLRIDIFPYDRIVNDPKIARKIKKTLDKIHTKIQIKCERRKSKNLFVGALRTMCSFFINARNEHQKFDRVSKKFDEDLNLHTVYFPGAVYGSPSILIFDEGDLQNTKRVEFSGITVNIPTSATNMLKKIYGDNWRTPIDRSNGATLKKRYYKLD